MGRSPDKNIKKINLKHALDLDRKGLLNRQYNLPPHKDTIAVPNNGYVVIRLKADNPGELNRLFCNILIAILWYKFKRCDGLDDNLAEPSSKCGIKMRTAIKIRSIPNTRAAFFAYFFAIHVIIYNIFLLFQGTGYSTATSYSI